MILNQVPGRLGLKLTTTFELDHNSKPDSKTWFELFSIKYFNHDTDNAESHSKLQAHTLEGIAVGRDDRSNSIIFYNPITFSYYHPPVGGTSQYFSIFGKTPISKNLEIGTTILDI